MRPTCKAEGERCLIRPGCRLEEKWFLIEKSEEKQYLMRYSCKADGERFLMRSGCIPEGEALPGWEALPDEAW